MRNLVKLGSRGKIVFKKQDNKDKIKKTSQDLEIKKNKYKFAIHYFNNLFTL